MQWSDSPYVLLLLVAGSISGILALACLSRRKSLGATPLAVLGLAVALWQVGYALELMGDNLSTKVFWAKFQYPGIAAIPSAWLAVTLHYTGRSDWLTRRNVALLAVVPVATVLLAWTNEAHGLIWSGMRLESSASLLWLVLDHGAWFWTFTAYSYLVLLLGIALVSGELLHSPRAYWAQATALLLSAIVPWMANWSFAVGLTPVPYLDLTPVAFLFGLFVLIWALLYAGLFNILPIAKQLVVDNMSNGVMVLDAMGRLVDSNPAAQRIVAQITGGSVRNSVTQVWLDNQNFDAMSRAATNARLELSTGDAQQNHYEVEVLPIIDRRSQHAGSLVLFQDVTDRKQKDQERRRLEVSALAQSKMATLGEVATGIAHEINQPLTYINTMIEATQEDVEQDRVDGTTMLRRLKESHRQVERITRIVDHLRTFGRTESTELTGVDIEAILDNTLELLGERFRIRNIALERTVEKALPEVHGNAGQLEQVFINLFQNSIDALSDNRENARITVGFGAAPDRSSVWVSFADTGKGIQPDQLEKVFEPFYTTKEVGQGTGLGLSIVYGIIQDHGGAISCESVVGEGTTLMITLPAALGNRPPSAD